MSQRKECKHLMPNGLNCKSPAVRGSDFCFFHGQPDQPTRPDRRPRATESPIDFPIILDPEDILIAVNQSLQGLAANVISTRRASILLMGIQMAAARLSSMPAGYDLQQLPPIFGFPDDPRVK